jgi:hypothetical protein
MVGLFYVGTVFVAAGVILIWGASGSVREIEVDTIGGVLLLVGLIAALISLVVRTRRDVSSFVSGDDESEIFRR